MHVTGDELVRVYKTKLTELQLVFSPRYSSALQFCLLSFGHLKYFAVYASIPQPTSLSVLTKWGLQVNLMSSFKKKKQTACLLLKTEVL